MCATRSLFHIATTVNARRGFHFWMLALWALTSLSISGLSSGVASAGEEVMIDGQLHLRNAATPGEGQRTLTLEEMWRVGGEDDEENIFGVIIQVLTDAEENVYLLDLQIAEVQVFSPDGEFLKTLSRQGEGPGELQYPVDMFMMPDGILGIIQAFPGKIVRIDLEGNPVDSVTPTFGDATAGGFMRLIDAHWSGDSYVLGGSRISVDQEAGRRTDANFVARCSTDGELKETYEERSVVFAFNDLSYHEEENYFPHLRRWTVDDGGRIYAAAYRNRYAINVYHPDGTLDRVIERVYQPWKRTPTEQSRVENQFAAQIRNTQVEIETSFEETEPDITSLRIAEDGSLWVLSSRGAREQPEGTMLTYDVFDPEGHFTEQVAVVCPGDGVQDGLIFAGEDRVIQIIGFQDAIETMQRQGASAADEEEEPAPMEIVCYRVAE